MPHAAAPPVKAPHVVRAPATRPADAPRDAPAAVRVTIVSVVAPPGFTFAPSGNADPKTGVRDDLKEAEAKAAKAHAKLDETPILTLAAGDGVPAAATARTSLLYAVPAPPGAPPGETLQTLALDGSLNVTARRLPSGFLGVRIAFTDTHAVGVAWRELAPPETESVSGSLEDTFKSGDTRYIARIPPDSPTGRLYFATVTLLPPAKG